VAQATVGDTESGLQACSFFQMQNSKLKIQNADMKDLLTF
jgi:hypothetical protein